MPAKEKSKSPSETRWAIALDWFGMNQRSAAALVKDHLCPGCSKRLYDKKEPSLKVLLETVHHCCSKAPEFISDKMPITESAFRLFLSNGNRPLTLKELSSELGKVRFVDVYRTSPELLSRILKNDSFYGIQEITG
jgi:hypothetical protein